MCLIASHVEWLTLNCVHFPAGALELTLVFAIEKTFVTHPARLRLDVAIMCVIDTISFLLVVRASSQATVCCLHRPIRPGEFTHGEASIANLM